MPDNSKQFLRSFSRFQAVLACLFNYFLLMDILMYFHVGSSPLRRPASNGTLDCAEYSPFCYVTAKALLLDHIDLYIFSPFISIVDSLFQISSYSLITPNLVTFCHVCIALVAARFVSSAFLADRRLAAILFEVRSLLDGLDGHIARARRHIHGELSEVGTAGYYIDGICDALGIVFFLTGVLIYLKNNSRREYTHLPTENLETLDRHVSINKSLIQRMACVVGQLLLSSLAWNRYIAAYQELLDGANSGPFAQLKSLSVIRSFRFQITALLWRIVNPHTYMHVLLLYIAMDKLSEFLSFTQSYGFLILVAVIGWSEIELFHVSATVLGEGSYFNNTIF